MTSTACFLSIAGILKFQIAHNQHTSTRDDRVRGSPIYVVMPNDFYRPTKIVSCAPGLNGMKLINAFVKDLFQTSYFTAERIKTIDNHHTREA